MIKRYYGISDLWFKKLFGNKDDKSLLCKYVNAICGLNIEPEYTEFSPLEIKDDSLGRGIRFDIRFREVHNHIHTHVNFEAQTTKPNDYSFDNRKFFYAASLFKDAFEEGDEFDKQVYSRTIFFMYDDPKLKNYPIRKTIFYEVNSKKMYNQVEIYEIYIGNLLREDFNNLDKYAKMISEITRVLVDLDYVKNNQSDNEIVKDVSKIMFNLSEEERERINKIEMRRFINEMDEVSDGWFEDGRQKGLEEGIEQGIEQAQVETIKKLSKHNMTARQISEVLELDLDYINSVLKQ